MSESSVREKRDMYCHLLCKVYIDSSVPFTQLVLSTFAGVVGTARSTHTLTQGIASGHVPVRPLL